MARYPGIATQPEDIFLATRQPDPDPSPPAGLPDRLVPRRVAERHRLLSQLRDPVGQLRRLAQCRGVGVRRRSCWRWRSIDFFRHRERRGRAGLYLLLVAAMWVVGFFNALDPRPRRLGDDADGADPVGDRRRCWPSRRRWSACAERAGWRQSDAATRRSSPSPSPPPLLAACGGSDPDPAQYGANPDASRDGARPAAQHEDFEADRAGAATCRRSPRAIRSARSPPTSRSRARRWCCPMATSWSPKARAGPTRRAMRPKDMIAGIIKKKGTSSVKGGDRLTLLRDADGDGRYEGRSVFAEKLNAPYGLALVGNALFVANQDALVRFDYRPGQTTASGPPTKVIDLPAYINHHWTKAMTASADGRSPLHRQRLQFEHRRARHGGRGRPRHGVAGRCRHRRLPSLRHGPAQPDRADRPAGQRAIVGGGQRARRARPQPRPRLHDLGAPGRLLRLALCLLGAERRSAHQAGQSGDGPRSAEARL